MRFLKLFIIFVCLIGLNVPQAIAQKATKIGFVDLSRLFDEYYKTKDYDKVLEEQHKSFEADRNTKIEKIQESQGKLALLNEDKKVELEEEIEKMKADLLEYDREKKTTLTKERNEKIREILLEIENVVSTYAEKESYSIILNDRVLIYGNPSIDVTEEILKNLNSNQPKK